MYISMKTTILAMLIMATCTTADAQEQRTLTILHTNDAHSTIYPLNKNLADTMKAGRGGFIRRMEVVKDEREKDDRLLLLDSGDFSQGSPYYTLFKGDVEVGLMNLMGYDAATIGNHEFDFGLENMARLFRKAHFAVVCANYDFSGTPVEGTVKPYVVLKRKGTKVGIFGLSPKMDGLVDSKNCEGVAYLDPIETAKETVRTLREKEGCDVVICLSHLGWDVQGMDDRKLIEETQGIDLVLGGHSHTYMEHLETVKDKEGQEVGVDQNGKHAIYVGKMVLTLEKDYSK